MKAVEKMFLSGFTFLALLYAFHICSYSAFGILFKVCAHILSYTRTTWYLNDIMSSFSMLYARISGFHSRWCFRTQIRFFQNYSMNNSLPLAFCPKIYLLLTPSTGVKSFCVVDILGLSLSFLFVFCNFCRYSVFADKT